uniref:Centromere protein S n=1 Tax=Prolemur simus TaxID=1328070 RepID=A0A8C9AGF4_PROSS
MGGVEAEEQQRLSCQQRLKAAVHYTVHCLCEDVASDKEMHFSGQTVAAILEMTVQQCKNFAEDLEMFPGGVIYCRGRRPGGDGRGCGEGRRT